MTDQRQAKRRTLEETPVAVIDIESGVEFHGAAKDVSASGLSFDSSMEPALGADMLVKMSGTEGLHATIEVTRVEPRDGRFAVAGRLINQRAG